MSYRETQNCWENQNRAIFDGAGRYGMPMIQAVHGTTADSWVPFSLDKSVRDPSKAGVHFFLDDYKFTGVWNRPDDYIERLRRFSAVASPDFSTYLDFPLAVRIWNIFRNRWLAAWWQLHGINVIPNVEWGTEEDFEWILDGLPKGAM